MPDQITEHPAPDGVDPTRVTTMRALRAHHRGGPETLVFEEAPAAQACARRGLDRGVGRCHHRDRTQLGPVVDDS